MATNPCRCGFHGSSLQQCRCSPLQVESYTEKLSGPLLDRIAIHVSVRPVDVDAWSSMTPSPMTSAGMRELVGVARAMQAERFVGSSGVDCNARIPEGMFSSLCAMAPAAEALFVRAQRALLFSARARGHVVRVARTIADIDGSAAIMEKHVAEAMGYRASVARG